MLGLASIDPQLRSQIFFQKLVEITMSDVQTTFAFLVIALVLVDQIGHAIYQTYEKEPRISILYNFVVKYW